MRRAYVANLASVLLAGCAVGPNYHRPTVVVPAAFLYEPAQAAAAANVDWWTQFNDPVLDQLIRDGLANNKSIKIAAANVEQASAIVTSTRAPLFPQVNYQGRGRPATSSHNTVRILRCSGKYLKSDQFLSGVGGCQLGTRFMGACPPSDRVGPSESLGNRASSPRK